jgi:hypothetical protein
MHELPTRATTVGVEPSDLDGVTVTQSPALPARGASAVKLITKFVEVSAATLLGETTTLLTGGLGVPIV